ncbi:hypothetical protein E3N88_16169 [Mikania micrantha]|uniref:Uncharacterized protein n=1 Tax=Mikania micrantha TaxID=192012 RepID=A0A5N6NXQ1_9ASTR|nr:hypothetical protein E3N88_16169 [Mikania micrantha]
MVISAQNLAAHPQHPTHKTLKPEPSKEHVIPAPSTRYVQTAAAKAAAMTEFDHSKSLETTASDELDEIIELPVLGSSFDSLELKNEFVYTDSVVDGWLYPPPVMNASGGDQEDRYVSGQEYVINTAFESLLWNY